MSKKIIFKNKIFNKKKLKEIIYDAFQNYGITRSCSLADEVKTLGFNYATKAGISISIEDLKVPPKKKDLIIIGNKEIIISANKITKGDVLYVPYCGDWLRVIKVVDYGDCVSIELKHNYYSINSYAFSCYYGIIIRISKDELKTVIRKKTIRDFVCKCKLDKLPLNIQGFNNSNVL